MIFSPCTIFLYVLIYKFLSKTLFSQWLLSYIFLNHGSFNEKFTIHLETILKLAVFSVICYNPICASQYFKYNFLFQQISLYIILAMLKTHIPMCYHPLFLILQSIIILWLKTCSISIFHTAVAGLTDYISVAQGRVATEI